MGMLAFGIVLVLVGVLLAATNFMGLGIIADEFWWIGWVVFAIGLILALLHFAMGPRRAVVYDRRI